MELRPSDHLRQCLLLALVAHKPMYHVSEDVSGGMGASHIDIGSNGLGSLHLVSTIYIILQYLSIF